MTSPGFGLPDVRATTAQRERTLGVLGGGQLGRMWVHAAQAAGWRTVVLEPDAASPAGAAADEHLCAAYDDPGAWQQLSRRCFAITTEFENVPADALDALATMASIDDDNPTPGRNSLVSPSAAAVRVCQHRAREKAAFVSAGVPCAPHRLIESDADFADSSALAALLPGILKTATMGYDGKGQRSVDDITTLRDAFAGLGRVPCLLEKKLALTLELSVIVARGQDGHCVHLPVQQNLHRDGILALTQVPAPDVPPETAAAAIAHARSLAAALGYVGVLCVEFFLLADGRLVANEMAPRPHNSGHWSLDGCDLSQFELQWRTMTGMPLAPPRQHSAAVMLNLLGDLWWPADAVADSTAREPDWASVLALPGVHLHRYGKSEPRRARKMGHLTVTAQTLAQARATASEAALRLGLPALPALSVLPARS
jgi:5-(carboxyamino)imidazole ribonucleotide synthase